VPNMIRRMMNARAFQTPGFQRYFRALHSGAGPPRRPDKLAPGRGPPEPVAVLPLRLTEAGPMVTRVQPHDVLREDIDGSIGKECLLAEAQVQDEAGEEPPPGELGEICVPGPGLMSGYSNRPEATAEVLRDGWLHTGDLAVRDAEGYFSFRDRARDMINSGGKNVYSAEIEQVPLTHPAVMEAVVLGAASTDWGEEARAVVVRRPGHTLEAGEVRAFLRERLAGYKVPQRAVFCGPGQMPYSPMGKLLKATLRRSSSGDAGRETDDR